MPETNPFTNPGSVANTSQSPVSSDPFTFTLGLALGSGSTIPTLLGRSNYPVWRSAIHPILMTHPASRALLSGSWTEPRRAADPVTDITAEGHAEAILAWESVNLSLSRFVRATLALNVRPFVRRHGDARVLWEALERLFGEKGGVAMVGGPF